MAVFTPIELSDISEWIASHFDIGHATDIRGIHGGIENSNFFLDTEKDGKQQEYVLTIFERLAAEQLPYYLELMRHLANKGIPVPKPVENKNGEILFSLKGKPAAIVSKLPGLSRLTPEAKHCTLVGKTLAKMHLAGTDFQHDQENLRSLAWWQKTVPQVLSYLSDSLKKNYSIASLLPKNNSLPLRLTPRYPRVQATVTCLEITYSLTLRVQVMPPKISLVASLTFILLEQISGYLIWQ